MVSPETGKVRIGRWNWVWPAVDTPEGAEWAVRQAFWAAILCALVTGGLALLAASGSGFAQGLGMDLDGIVDAALFGAIAVALWKQSRVAVWAGLALYCLERVYMWSTVGPKNPVIAVIFILAFVGGVRGTSALRRLREQQH